MSQARNHRQRGSKQGLFFGPEYEGDMFLRNVGLFSTDYISLYFTRYNSSISKPIEEKSAVKLSPEFHKFMKMSNGWVL
jgi:hypothetical protein